MNRKKAAKVLRETTEQEMARKALEVDRTRLALSTLHPYDDPAEWLKGGFEKAPWPQDKIDEFQRRLDSAFGGEQAIVLVWSGDRSYGDTFLNEKGEPERKPVLLFGEYKVNENDYVYLTCPRWLLMEVYHGSQLAASWEASSWADDFDGIPRRIRPATPPEKFYSHLRVIAEHEGASINGFPACCERLWQAGKRICYGKYREPDFRDIEFVGKTQENMRKAGVDQRSDEQRSAKVLMDAALGAKHFRERAEQQKSQQLKEFMMANSGSFFQGILDKVGSTMSARERDEIVLDALNAQDDERFSKETV